MTDTSQYYILKGDNCWYLIDGHGEILISKHASEEEARQALMNATDSGGWIGVDLDGTLAEHRGWLPIDVIGKPIPLMVERIKRWLAEGREIKIFTARVGADNPICKISRKQFTKAQITSIIQKWLIKECGLPAFEVTCQKDYRMLELWDDRCIQVVPNTGRTLAEEHEAEMSALKGKSWSPEK